MSTLTSNACNALRIAGELYPEGGFEAFLSEPSAPLFARTCSAAAIMTAVEEAPGFQWNEGTQTDWETACARIARIIEKKHPTLTAIRRACRRRFFQVKKPMR
jgi:hypothetical protein